MEILITEVSISNLFLRKYLMENTSKNQARRERLFLLDGSALAYRAYFSFISRPLITSKGENISVVGNPTSFCALISHRVCFKNSAMSISASFNAPFAPFNVYRSTSSWYGKTITLPSGWRILADFPCGEFH